MRHKIYLILLCTFASAGTVAGQCPGPAVRTALLNLQRANTTLTTNTVTGPRAGQFGLTDSCGNQRYQYYVRVLDSVDCICCNPFTTPAIGAPASAFVKICGTDSLFYFDWKREPLFLGESLTITQILDSLQNDTAFQRNWYTVDDTTTSLLRTAYILEGAQWLANAENASIYFQAGELAGGRSFVNTEASSIYFEDASGANEIIASAIGLDLFTSQTASRAVNIRSDTVNTSGSLDPTNFRLNFNSDYSYLYADSLKIVGLGQFTTFPGLGSDGTDKGFYYTGEGAGVVHGDGTNGNFVRILGTAIGEFDLLSQNAAGDLSNVSATNADDEQSVTIRSIMGASEFAESYVFVTSHSDVAESDGISLNHLEKGENVTAFVSLGDNFIDNVGRAFGVTTTFSSTDFTWIQSEIPNDTTSQAISFYNRAYYWPNARPSNTLNDTSVIVWIGDGTNAGKHPQFVPLPGAGSTVNWYNSNGTTTENTRIADVLETATWRSDNVTLDGIVPFRFELAGSPANEPEMMTWQFDNGDSLLLYRSDQEIVFNSNTSTVFRSDVSTQLNAPTTSMSNNVGGFLTLNDAGTLSHSAATMHYNLSNGSSGTSQVELLITGPFTPITLTAAQTLNFRVSVRARCTNVGNGVGITSGDSYASWNVGCIKLVGTTTSIVGTVQQVVADQADTGMSTAVTTIDADDTDESLRIRFTPPSTAGTTTVIAITATVEITQ